MGFWSTSDGEDAAKTGQEYEVPGGNLDPIPDGSTVMAMVDEAKWAETQQGDRYVSLRWSVLAPKEYENRKVFHKLWVTDHDQNAKDQAKAIAKTDKARKMLAAIDANAGGKLTAVDRVPTDDDLALALLNKPMTITLMTWESNTGGNGGNWVCAVGPKAKELKIGTAKAPAKARTASQGSGGAYAGGYDDGDSIPFAPMM